MPFLRGRSASPRTVAIEAGSDYAFDTSSLSWFLPNRELHIFYNANRRLGGDGEQNPDHNPGAEREQHQEEMEKASGPTLLRTRRCLCDSPPCCTPSWPRRRRRWPVELFSRAWTVAGVPLRPGRRLRDVRGGGYNYVVETAHCEPGGTRAERQPHHRLVKG
jgi:hypothetical protein